MLPGVDLHAVEPARHGEAGGVVEPGDDGGDVVGLHPLGHLAARHLGHPARGPQLALVVGRAALTAGVAEGGDHERAVGPAGIGHGPPPWPAVGGQRRPLVRPVRWMDAGLLDHDRAAAAACAPFVVGDMARRDSPVVAEVGDVRAEQQPVAGGAPAEDDRFEQAHRGLGSGSQRRSRQGRRVSRTGTGFE